MKIKAIGFDLGDTLVYSGQPLNWSNNYKNALEKGFYSINKNVDIIISSVDVGYRKPNITGYRMLAKKLGIEINELVNL